MNRYRSIASALSLLAGRAFRGSAFTQRPSVKRVAFSRRCLWLLASFFALSAANGQTLPDRGVIPTSFYHASENEDVNLVNGNMRYKVPLYKFPPGPGGQSFQIDLIYNSFIWDPSAATGTTN